MTPSFYQSNRNKIIRATNGGIIVVAAYTKMQRGGDTAFWFEQESNFLWLTGINMPDWWVIIDGTRHKTWLVSPRVSDVSQVFDGSLSVQSAKEISGVDDVVEYDQGIKLLRDLAKKHSVVHALGNHPYVDYFDFTLNPAPKKIHDLLSRTFNSVQDCRAELAKLRAIKTSDEIASIQQAINLTVDAFDQVKSHLLSFKREYEIEAEFTYHFQKNGVQQHAYDPIVAAGKNACTLHYGQNIAKLKKKELILMDVGAQKNGYCADISRTYAFGEPTKRQIQVHAVVRDAQQQIIELLGPETLVEQYQRDVTGIMKEALFGLGLMSSLADDKSYHRYFPHAIGHGLGIDPHDSLGNPRLFMSGMVMTVEPGVYIPEEGIGVRLEDDILITDKGFRNLSSHLSTEL